MSKHKTPMFLVPMFYPFLPAAHSDKGLRTVNFIILLLFAVTGTQLLFAVTGTTTFTAVKAAQIYYLNRSCSNQDIYFRKNYCWILDTLYTYISWCFSDRCYI